jgi:hypothetical protein
MPMFEKGERKRSIKAPVLQKHTEEFQEDGNVSEDD